MLNGEKCVKISLDVEAKLNSVGKGPLLLPGYPRFYLDFLRHHFT